MAPDPNHPLRRILLVIYFIGLVGLAAELFLLEHFDDVWQWVPLVLLGAGLLAGLAVALRPGRAVILSFRALMAAFVAAGGVGAYLHLRG
ncbi:MAG TPA: hypothetical protein VF613_26175, partial [Longimicrobium sp.]